MTEVYTNQEFVRDIARVVTLNAAASAAATIGVVGGLIVVGSLFEKFGKKTPAK